MLNSRQKGQSQASPRYLAVLILGLKCFHAYCKPLHDKQRGGSSNIWMASSVVAKQLHAYTLFPFSGVARHSRTFTAPAVPIHAQTSCHPSRLQGTLRGSPLLIIVTGLRSVSRTCLARISSRRRSTLYRLPLQRYACAYSTVMCAALTPKQLSTTSQRLTIMQEPPPHSPAVAPQTSP